jgi:hypothetical protein
MFVRVTYVIDEHVFVQRVVDTENEMTLKGMATHHKIYSYHGQPYIMPVDENTFMTIPDERMERAIVKVERLDKDDVVDYMSLKEFKRLAILEAEDDFLPPAEK